MKVISSERDYRLIEIEIDGVIDRSKSLPDNVFQEGLKHYLFITFDELLMPLFFNHLKQYLIYIADKDFWLAAVDPNPRSYFAANFGFFGAFEFSITDNEGNYISALNDYPAESPADALMHNSNSLIISTHKNKWVVFGSRETDIAICAFHEHTQMELFRLAYACDLLADVKAAAEYAYDASRNKHQINRFLTSYSASRAD